MVVSTFQWFTYVLSRGHFSTVGSVDSIWSAYQSMRYAYVSGLSFSFLYPSYRSMGVRGSPVGDGEPSLIQASEKKTPRMYVCIYA